MNWNIVSSSVCNDIKAFLSSKYKCKQYKDFKSNVKYFIFHKIFLNNIFDMKFPKYLQERK